MVKLMDISKIDSNFKTVAVTADDVEWHDPKIAPFSIRGIYFSKEENKYVRLPKSIGEQTNAGVLGLRSRTAGGRIRFKTDSPYIAIKSISQNCAIMAHMPITGTYGFSVYVNGIYYQKVMPDWPDIDRNESDVEFDGMVKVAPYVDGEVYNVEIFTPLYSGVNEVYIGLQENCKILPADPYKYEQPIVFYGSSITQGACASRPGNDYIGHLCRKLNTDVINLGFSGSCRGEKVFADYLATLDASIYVIDYDYNAPTVQHLKDTHYPLYQTLRNAHKDTPIVFISKPDFNSKHAFIEMKEENVLRREVIFDTYTKAKAEGDKNVYFIDGESLFANVDYDACTVDGCHPNDLGFYQIAQVVYPVLKNILEK